MKKVYMTILALILVFSMSVTAFAAESPATNDGKDSTSINITGSIVRTEYETVMSVTLSWDAMDFTYTEGEKGEWLPDEHKYADDEPGTWSDNQPKILVTNHSNTAVSATFGFESKVDGLVGEFTERNGTDNDNKIVLATAEGTAVESAPSASASFGVSGSGISATQRIGTITITIAAASAEEVPVVTGITTYEALQAALSEGGDVTLASDIVVPSETSLEVPEGKSVNIDLNGYSIYGSDMQPLTNYGTLVLNDTFGGGGIYALTEAGAIYSTGYLHIRNGTYSGYAGIVSTGTVNIEKATSVSDFAGVMMYKDDETGAELTVDCGDDNANIAITGGSYSIVVLDGATAEIRSGTMNGEIISSLEEDATVRLDTGITITGGIFDREPYESYVADGFEAWFEDGSGWIIETATYG